VSVSAQADARETLLETLLETLPSASYAVPFRTVFQPGIEAYKNWSLKLSSDAWSHRK